MLNTTSKYICFLSECSNYGAFFGDRIKFQNKFNYIYRVYVEKLESEADVDSQILDRPEKKQRQSLGLD